MALDYILSCELDRVHRADVLDRLQGKLGATPQMDRHHVHLHRPNRALTFDEALLLQAYLISKIQIRRKPRMHRNEPKRRDCLYDKCLINNFLDNNC